MPFGRFIPDRRIADPFPFGACISNWGITMDVDVFLYWCSFTTSLKAVCSKCTMPCGTCHDLSYFMNKVLFNIQGECSKISDGQAKLDLLLNHRCQPCKFGSANSCGIWVGKIILRQVYDFLGGNVVGSWEGGKLRGIRCWNSVRMSV